jgi:hypothetical protein
MTAQISSALPLMLRLNALESKILGTTSHAGPNSQKADPAKLGESSKTALRRIRELEEGLDSVGADHDALKRFIRNCKSKSECA